MQNRMGFEVVRLPERVYRCTTWEDPASLNSTFETSNNILSTVETLTWRISQDRYYHAARLTHLVGHCAGILGCMPRYESISLS